MKEVGSADGLLSSMVESWRQKKMLDSNDLVSSQ